MSPKLRLRLRRNHLGVSPVIATILMVAITVVLAAVLYALIQNVLVPPGGGAPTVALDTPQRQPDGTWKVGVLRTTQDVALGNFQFALLNGTTPAYNLTDVHSGGLGTQNGVTVTFTDFGGPGKLSAGDYFVIAGLKTGNTYEVDLYWKGSQSIVLDKKSINA